MRDKWFTKFQKIGIDISIGYSYSTNHTLYYKEPKMFTSFIKCCLLDVYVVSVLKYNFRNYTFNLDHSTYDSKVKYSTNHIIRPTKRSVQL